MTPRERIRTTDLIKTTAFLAGLAPLAWLSACALSGGLGANPVETITHFTGDWTLRLLLLTLTASPLRGISGWQWPLQLRRMLGLYTFFYACLHATTYFVLDLELDLGGLAEDVAKRPYITVGFTAFVLLIPLAATSTRRMIKRLGRNWQRLHRAVYAIGVLGVLHYLWLVKADLREPLVYATLLLLLLGWRVYRRVLIPRLNAAARARAASA